MTPIRIQQSYDVIFLILLVVVVDPVVPTIADSSNNAAANHPFLRKRSNLISEPHSSSLLSATTWTWGFLTRHKNNQKTASTRRINVTTSFLRDQHQQQRDLIVNDKTTADGDEESSSSSSSSSTGSLFAKFNPLTLLGKGGGTGHRANISQFPFFTHWSDAYCGASLIHDDIVLTAAHCGKEQPDSPLDMKEVRINSEFRLEGGVQRVVVHQEVHPQYNANLRVFDFQLLKLDRSALYDYEGNTTKPTGAALVQMNTNYYNPPVGADLTAVGFGETSADGTDGESDVLMDVHFTRFDHSLCEEQYGPKRIPDNVMMCMGVEGGGKDVCQGDSGGPILDSNGTQVAVVSWGHGCAEKDYAGINARLSSATKWIQRQICRLSSYPPASCDKASMQSVLHRPPITLVQNLKDDSKNGDKGYDSSNGIVVVDGNVDPSIQTPNIGDITLRVNVQHDKYPMETSWDFRHMDSFVQLYWQPYKTVQKPFTTVSKEFQDLPAGTYRLRISDSAYDGTCCKYGKGSFSITTTTSSAAGATPDKIQGVQRTDGRDGDVINDSKNNKILWKHQGNFTRYMEVTLQLDIDGTVVYKDEKYKYTSPSLEATQRNSKVTENNPAKNDHEWPGAYPIRSEKNAMAVNVRHDDFPDQVEWAVWYYKPLDENSTNTTTGDTTRTDLVRRDLLAAAASVAPITAPPASAPPISTPPISVAPVTASPVTYSPVTYSPVTAAPATAQPITAPPVTTSPISSAPITSPPISSAPLESSAPMTIAPISAPPVTAPPVLPEGGESTRHHRRALMTNTTGPGGGRPGPGANRGQTSGGLYQNTDGIDHTTAPGGRPGPGVNRGQSFNIASGGLYENTDGIDHKETTKKVMQKDGIEVPPTTTKAPRNKTKAPLETNRQGTGAPGNETETPTTTRVPSTDSPGTVTEAPSVTNQTVVPIGAPGNETETPNTTEVPSTDAPGNVTHAPSERNQTLAPTGTLRNETKAPNSTEGPSTEAPRNTTVAPSATNQTLAPTGTLKNETKVPNSTEGPSTETVAPSATNKTVAPIGAPRNETEPPNGTEVPINKINSTDYVAPAPTQAVLKRKNSNSSSTSATKFTKQPSAPIGGNYTNRPNPTPSNASNAPISMQPTVIRHTTNSPSTNPTALSPTLAPTTKCSNFIDYIFNDDDGDESSTLGSIFRKVGECFGANASLPDYLLKLSLPDGWGDWTSPEVIDHLGATVDNLTLPENFTLPGFDTMKFSKSNEMEDASHCSIMLDDLTKGKGKTNSTGPVNEGFFDKLEDCLSDMFGNMALPKDLTNLTMKELAQYVSKFTMPEGVGENLHNVSSYDTNEAEKAGNNTEEITPAPVVLHHVASNFSNSAANFTHDKSGDALKPSSDRDGLKPNRSATTFATGNSGNSSVAGPTSNYTNSSVPATNTSRVTVSPTRSPTPTSSPHGTHPLARRSNYTNSSVPETVTATLSPTSSPNVGNGTHPMAGTANYTNSPVPETITPTLSPTSSPNVNNGTHPLARKSNYTNSSVPATITPTVSPTSSPSVKNDTHPTASKPIPTTYTSRSLPPYTKKTLAPNDANYTHYPTPTASTAVPSNASNVVNYIQAISTIPHSNSPSASPTFLSPTRAPTTAKCSNFFDFMFNNDSDTLGDMFSKLTICIEHFLNSGSHVSDDSDKSAEPPVWQKITLPGTLQNVTLPNFWQNFSTLEFLDYVSAALKNSTTSDPINNLTKIEVVYSEYGGSNETAEGTHNACSSIFDNLKKEKVNGKTSVVSEAFFDSLNQCLRSVFGNFTLPERTKNFTMMELGVYFGDFFQNFTSVKELGASIDNFTLPGGDEAEEKDGDEIGNSNKSEAEGLLHGLTAGIGEYFGNLSMPATLENFSLPGMKDIVGTLPPLLLGPFGGKEEAERPNRAQQFFAHSTNASDTDGYNHTKPAPSNNHTKATASKNTAPPVRGTQAPLPEHQTSPPRVQEPSDDDSVGVSFGHDWHEDAADSNDANESSVEEDKSFLDAILNFLGLGSDEETDANEVNTTGDGKDLRGGEVEIDDLLDGVDKVVSSASNSTTANASSGLNKDVLEAVETMVSVVNVTGVRNKTSEGIAVNSTGPSKSDVRNVSSSRNPDHADLDDLQDAMDTIVSFAAENEIQKSFSNQWRPGDDAVETDEMKSGNGDDGFVGAPVNLDSDDKLADENGKLSSDQLEEEENNIAADKVKAGDRSNVAPGALSSERDHQQTDERERTFSNQWKQEEDAVEVDQARSGDSGNSSPGVPGEMNLDKQDQHADEEKTFSNQWKEDKDAVEVGQAKSGNAGIGGGANSRGILAVTGNGGEYKSFSRPFEVDYDEKASADENDKSGLHDEKSFYLKGFPSGTLGSGGGDEQTNQGGAANANNRQGIKVERLEDEKRTISVERQGNSLEQRSAPKAAIATANDHEDRQGTKIERLEDEKRTIGVERQGNNLGLRIAPKGSITTVGDHEDRQGTKVERSADEKRTISVERQGNNLYQRGTPKGGAVAAVAAEHEELYKDGEESYKDGNLTMIDGHLHPGQPPKAKVNSTGVAGLESSDHKWTRLYKSGLSDGRSNTVETHFFYHLQPGLYAFVLSDTQGDGICCKHRYGWMTIIGSDQDVVWNNNGEFAEKVHVLIRLDEDGSFHVVKTTVDGMELKKKIKPTSAPGTTSPTTKQVDAVVSTASVSHNNETRYRF